MVAKQNGIALRQPNESNQTKIPRTISPAVYSLAKTQPHVNPASKSQRLARTHCQIPRPALRIPHSPCRSIAQIAMASKPTTKACENIIVAYGNGAAPRQIARQLTKADFAGTWFSNHLNKQPVPKAVIIPIEPTHATQLENSQPVSESKGTPNNDKIPAARAKGGRARAAVPGALSL